jgi:hypothetical protein
MADRSRKPRAKNRQGVFSSSAATFANFYLAASLVVGCSSVDRYGAVQSTMSFLESDSAGVVSPSAVDARCTGKFPLILLEYRTIGDGCELETGDTITYSWRDSAEVVLVRGRQISVNAERLRQLGDSVQLRIAKSLGHGTDCYGWDNTARYSTHFHLWRRNNRTVFLRTTIIPRSMLSKLTVEIAVGERGCKSYIGRGLESL